jgi:hypothetical protein
VVYSSRVLVSIFKVLYDLCHLWLSSYPTSQSSCIIINWSTISFDAGIVLLLCLVDCDLLEDICLLLQSSLNILDTQYLWMPSRKFIHPFQLHWNPPGIVFLVHGMESSVQFCQSIKNIVKDACQKPYIYIEQQLQFNTVDQYWNWSLSTPF